MMDPAAPPAGPPAGPSLEERLRAAQQETARRGAGTRAFISYARRDGDVARRLVAALDEAGIEAWVDWKDIPGTAAWREEIAAGIEAADSVIVLLSPAALASQPCRDEIDHALRYNKRIVPVVCAEVASAACPPEIERLNWLWLRPQDDFAAGMAALLAALRTDLEWVRLHTHLLERAVEWQARGHEASLLLRGANLRAAEAWLGGAQDKDPAPTALHAQYILASRRAETARQRLTVGATSAGMVIALALAVAALLFQQQAMRNQQAAQRQQHIAEQQRALAEQQRALAVARLVTAEANVLRAQSAQSADMLETSTLLALEAERRLPSVDAATTLGLDLRVLPPPLWSATGPVLDTLQRSVAFDPAGPWIADVGSACGGVRPSVGCVPSPVPALIRIRAARDDTVARALPVGAVVRDVLFSPDGRWLAAALAGGTVRVWRVSGWAPVATLAGDSGIAPRLDWSPDGRTLLLLLPGTLSVWDSARGWQRVWHDPHTDVLAAAAAPGGRVLATIEGGQGATLRVYALLSRGLLAQQSVPGGGHGVPVLRFSPRGDALIVSCGTSYYTASALCVWHAGAGGGSGDWRFSGVLTDGGATPLDAAFSPDGRVLAVAWQTTLSTALQARGGPGWARVQTLAQSGPTGQLLPGGLAFSRDGAELAAAMGATARVWSVATGQETARAIQPAAISTVAFVDGRRAVATFAPARGVYGQPLLSGGALRLWNLAAGGWSQVARTLPTQASALARITLSQDGRYLEVADSNQGQSPTARVWDLRRGRLIGGPWTRVWPGLPDPLPVHALALSPDGRAVAVESDFGAIAVYAVPSGRRVALLPAVPVPGDLAFGPGAATLAVTQDSAFSHAAPVIWLFDLRRPRAAPRVLGLPHTRLTPILSGPSFSPNGRYLTVFDQMANTLDILDMARGGHEVARLDTDLRFSPDSRYAVAQVGLSSTGARVLAVGSWRTVAVLPAPGYLADAAFSPDGRYLATVAGDTTIHLWRVGGDWGEIEQITAPDGVIALAFSADGHELATTADGATRLWAWRPGDLVAQGCARVTRNLTRTEWALYVAGEPYRRTCPALAGLGGA